VQQGHGAAGGEGLRPGPGPGNDTALAARPPAISRSRSEAWSLKDFC
jgi:hypothetical protein